MAAKPCNCKCAQRDPIETLKQEHRVIERVLDAAEHAAAFPAIEEDFFAQTIDFFRVFADGCHHAKEEDELFPRLESAGIPNEGGPIACMLDEHTQGRTLIGRMIHNLPAAGEGDAAAAAAFREALHAYVKLLRQHIWKEDNVLFALADRTLDERQRRALQHAFEHSPACSSQPGKHERYVELADSLYERAFGAAIRSAS